MDNNRLNTHTNRFHNDLHVLPFFNEADISDALVHVPRVNRYIKKIKRLKSAHPNNLLVLHINICSIRTKMQFIDEILKLKIVDVLFINETFLDDDTPGSFYKNINYVQLRRDRDQGDEDKQGGGLLIFARKGYMVKEAEKSPDFESIAFTITVKSTKYNFIASYKPPKEQNDEYIEHLESLMINFDPTEPLFIVGDLNMDLLSSAGDDLKEFMISNELKNGVTEPTRTQTSFYKSDNEYRTSSTLIDVILHNQDLIEKTLVIDCPFSDHSFVISSLKIEKVKLEPQSIMCRNLSEPVLEQIITELSLIDLKVSLSHDIESNWTRI